MAGDPRAPSEEASRGELLVQVGKLFEKGQRIGTGQANVKSYNRHLRDLIIAGKAKPSFEVSKELPLKAAPDAYARFDKRDEGYSKVVLKPVNRRRLAGLLATRFGVFEAGKASLRTPRRDRPATRPPRPFRHERVTA